MDNLSSLSSGLPARPSASQELAALDSQLIDEFKTAACAVTKLYKLAGTKNRAIRQQGYLDAVQDVLAVLTGNSSSVDEVLAWALQKQDELAPILSAETGTSPVRKTTTSRPATTTTTTTPDKKQQAPPLVLDPAYQFTFEQQASHATTPMPQSFTGHMFSFGDAEHSDSSSSSPERGGDDSSLKRRKGKRHDREAKRPRQ